MIGVKQLYESMTKFRSPFAKVCATMGAFSGFFGVNSYYLRKNCNHFIDNVEKEFNVGGKVIINDNGININNEIIIDYNSIRIKDKQIKTSNGRIARFKMNTMDYLMIKNAPYYVNFLTGTIMWSAIGYIYGMYFPVTIPTTIAYAVISNIIDDE
jgi:hypothetical protein